MKPFRNDPKVQEDKCYAYLEGLVYNACTERKWPLVAGDPSWQGTEIHDTQSKTYIILQPK